MVDEKLPYYLEIGACKPTSLTLINNGIPRTAAIIMSEKLPQDLSDFTLCKESLKDYRNFLRREIPSPLLEGSDL